MHGARTLIGRQLKEREREETQFPKFSAQHPQVSYLMQRFGFYRKKVKARMTNFFNTSRNCQSNPPCAYAVPTAIGWSGMCGTNSSKISRCMFTGPTLDYCGSFLFFLKKTGSGRQWGINGVIIIAAPSSLSPSSVLEGNKSWVTKPIGYGRGYINPISCNNDKEFLL